jgi:hypothetical protein
MSAKENFTTGRFDRRVNLLRPVDVENEYNEAQTSYVPAYSNFPAHRKDSVTTDGEQQDAKAIQATNITEWELRYIPNLGVKSTWRLVDVFNKQVYQIISPVTEIGRRQAYRVKTMIVE